LEPNGIDDVDRLEYGDAVEGAEVIGISRHKPMISVGVR